jgi:hypothetical protein
MADVATEFLQAISAFGATRLGRASSTSFKNSKSLVGSLFDSVPNNTKPAYKKLKEQIEADVEPLVKPIVEKIEKQTALIAKMASESLADAKASDFATAQAGRIATRIGTALLAMDEAINIDATEVARDANGVVDEALRVALMGIWNPWVQPFKDLGDGAGKLLDSFGKQVLGIESATKSLGKTLTFVGPGNGGPLDTFRLAASLASTSERNFGVLRLNETRLEAFFGFARREFVNPSEQQKLELVERDGKWWRADEAVFGLRIFTLVRPGIQNDPLLKKVMPGSSDPTTIKPTAITLDSLDGLYLGDGQGAGNEKVVLATQFNFPAVEIREVALGIVRNPAKEVTGLEVTTVIAAKLGDAIGLQVGGAGVSIALDGQSSAAIFPWDVSPRWPDAIGLRVKAGPIKGGGSLERKVRTYGTGADKKELVEFGGVIQLEILKVGVYAIGILSPDPFSLVLVMGMRFPTAIELSFGFTFNGIGGILALNRRVDTGELVKGMQTHLIDRVLFPEDPVAEAPKLLDQVAKVFPPFEGGFVVGPIIELGWGSQAKIIEAKIGIILALPDPRIIILGAVRVRAPSKVTPVTDFRCEVYGEISSERLLIVATLRDSKIAGIAVSGDLGLLIQWGGDETFALSVGGFHPRYTEAPAPLKDLARLTMDLSPPKVVKIIIKAYFAVTAGAVMAGVRGDLNADVGVATAHAWLQLDMIFRWVPRFGFVIDLEFGIDISVFGASFANISFKGSLEGTTPWTIQGIATVDVWWLPTFDLDLGPYTWGESPPAIESSKSPLALVREALGEREAWKALMPLDGDLLVTLGRADVEGLVAHPLSALEVTQSRLPLETHIDRIGSAGVTANRVNLGLPTTSAGPVGAVSTVTAPFSPGQFLALEGEALLAGSGFDDLPSGCRLGAATTPVSGTSSHEDVRWHTYFRDEEQEPILFDFDPGMFTEMLVGQSLVGRIVADRENPYVPRTSKVNPNPAAKVSVLPIGASTVHHVDDGGTVLADLGVLTANEAARVAGEVNRSGTGHVAAVAVGVM